MLEYDRDETEVWRPEYEIFGGGDHVVEPAAYTHTAHVIDGSTLPQVTLIPPGRDKDEPTDTPVVAAPPTYELFTAGQRAKGGETNWLLWLLVAAGVGVAIWYFSGGQKKR